ncbi:hypothetical protein P153DRAFT_138795 [Dothidotthia symphoricarpi CBS 119687]|uniref:Uncharacterized protein n=1 Tax=Dothidotthia symphoricarpi CBS 119687 TaxID=1392245 RepID=A0A6A5ZZH8_9PLEO|nr:uncharacterized protein P153DRAFT_138795 [Dothidotthia symphoricarpi CBS 119687]KAF2124293.1 hypothetical protein P153DRAFT_138795 [Dothidotthia symphoricarpi CBS 119687]
MQCYIGAHKAKNEETSKHVVGKASPAHLHSCLEICMSLMQRRLRRTQKSHLATLNEPLQCKKERCILRESNPNQLLGRQLSYRWTKDAVEHPTVCR